MCLVDQIQIFAVTKTHTARLSMNILDHGYSYQKKTHDFFQLNWPSLLLDLNQINLIATGGIEQLDPEWMRFRLILSELK